MAIVPKLSYCVGYDMADRRFHLFEGANVRYFYTSEGAQEFADYLNGQRILRLPGAVSEWKVYTTILEEKTKGAVPAPPCADEYGMPASAF